MREDLINYSPINGFSKYMRTKRGGGVDKIDSNQKISKAQFRGANTFHLTSPTSHELFPTQNKFGKITPLRF
jgi:hypothetical protein